MSKSTLSNEGHLSFCKEDGKDAILENFHLWAYHGFNAAFDWMRRCTGDVGQY